VPWPYVTSNGMIERPIWIRCARSCIVPESPHALLVQRAQRTQEQSRRRSGSNLRSRVRSSQFFRLSCISSHSENSTGSIASRSHTLHQQLQDRIPGRGINFIAHSMGGLDCRYLISHIKPTQYAPLSLTTISTPHQGSPFMDWCAVRVLKYLITCNVLIPTR
jgi:hypothetical protein